MAEGKSVSVALLNGSNYSTWKVQCTMALKKEGLWAIVSGAEKAPEGDRELELRFNGRKD